MTKKQIEGNRIIAEFMGLTPESTTDNRYHNTPNRFYKYDTDHWKVSNTCRPETMQYHISWDWLMMAVIKIEENLEYNVEINHNNCTITHFETVFGQTKIEAVYNAVIEFIKWFNENNANKQ